MRKPQVNCLFKVLIGVLCLLSFPSLSDAHGTRRMIRCAKGAGRCGDIHHRLGFPVRPQNRRANLILQLNLEPQVAPTNHFPVPDLGSSEDSDSGSVLDRRTPPAAVTIRRPSLLQRFLGVFKRHQF